MAVEMGLHRFWHSPQLHQGLFTDPVYGFDDWNLHRSATHRHRLTPFTCLRVAYGFTWLLIWVVALSFGVAFYYKYAVPRGAPDASAEHLMVPFNMITFALSLLILFKTNSSYSRWWEGRVIWGQMLNYSRNLPRQLLAFTRLSRNPRLAHAQRDLLRVALRWVAASAYVLKGHLRQATAAKAEEEAAHLLTPGEREYLRTYWGNRPQGVAFVLSWLCMHDALGLNMQQQVAIQEQLTLFVNNCGGCERIQRTPIPRAYTRHTSRFLLFYVTFAPIALWPAVGWATPAIAPLIAFLLLGTENIGIQIEEPFRVLPLDAICRGIEAGLRDLAAAGLTEPGEDKDPWRLDALPEAVVLSRQKHAAHGTMPVPCPYLPIVLGLDVHRELRETGLWSAGSGMDRDDQPVRRSSPLRASRASHAAAAVRDVSAPPPVSASSCSPEDLDVAVVPMAGPTVQLSHMVVAENGSIESSRQAPAPATSSDSDTLNRILDSAGGLPVGVWGLSGEDRRASAGAGATLGPKEDDGYMP